MGGRRKEKCEGLLGEGGSAAAPREGGTEEGGQSATQMRSDRASRRERERERGRGERQTDRPREKWGGKREMERQAKREPKRHRHEEKASALLLENKVTNWRMGRRSASIERFLRVAQRCTIDGSVAALREINAPQGVPVSSALRTWKSNMEGACRIQGKGIEAEHGGRERGRSFRLPSF